MHASQLKGPVPTAPASATVADVARRVADEALPGVVVVGPEPNRMRWVSTAHLLRLIAPSYARDDLAVAALLDSADDLGTQSTCAAAVGEVLAGDDVRHEIERVDADAGLLELASRLVHAKAPLLLVESDDDSPGFVTDARVLRALTDASDRGEAGS